MCLISKLFGCQLLMCFQIKIKMLGIKPILICVCLQACFLKETLVMYGFLKGLVSINCESDYLLLVNFFLLVYLQKRSMGCRFKI